MTLVVSYWDIGLENIPPGAFQHRVLDPEEARQLIEATRVNGDRVIGASHDDLFAPYKENTRNDHAKLTKVLADEYGIQLSSETFTNEIKDEQGETIISGNPLGLFRISGDLRILVVNCNWEMLAEKKKGGGTLQLQIAADSVEFHLFELL